MSNQFETIVKACQFLLNNYPAAQESKNYLNSRLSEHSQNKWEFGYLPPSEHLVALIDLVGAQILLDTGLIHNKKIEDAHSQRKVLYSNFEHFPIVMPFRNTYGEIVGLVARTILDEPTRIMLEISKYKNTAELPKNKVLFGLYEHKQAILERECVYVVEGQMDAIKAAEIGLHNVVALGTNSCSNYQLSLISRYSDNIFVLLDNDEAGQRGRTKFTTKFGQLVNINNLYLPNGYKDIDEYICKEEITDYTDLSFEI